MAARTKLNHSEMANLLKGGDVEAYLSSKIQKALSVAQANAPVATGAYRAGLHVEIVHHPTRVVARVAGSTDHDMVVEADTGNLARALDAAK